MQPCEVACPSQVFAMNAAGRFPFQPPYSIRHTILGWNAQTQMHMVGHGIPLDQFDTHLIAEFPQELADVLTERTKDCLLPLLRYDDDVVSAIPPDMALVVPFAHCGFSFWWPWRVHNGRNRISLHASTPERQSLFESHRQRRWLTHWSYSRVRRRAWENPSQKSHPVFWPAQPDSPKKGTDNVLALQCDIMEDNTILSK